MEIPEVVRTFWPLLLLQLALAVAALVDIARRKTFRYLPKTAWILISIFVSTIGPVVYFLVGRGEE